MIVLHSVHSYSNTYMSFHHPYTANNARPSPLPLTLQFPITLGNPTEVILFQGISENNFFKKKFILYNQPPAWQENHRKQITIPA